MWFLSISQININGFLAWTALLLMKLQTFAFAFMHFGQTLLSKAAYIVFKVNIWSALAFLRNRTHDLGIASSMLYFLSFRMVRFPQAWKTCKYQGIWSKWFLKLFYIFSFSLIIKIFIWTYFLFFMSAVSIKTNFGDVCMFLDVQTPHPDYK